MLIDTGSNDREPNIDRPMTGSDSSSDELSLPSLIHARSTLEEGDPSSHNPYKNNRFSRYVRTLPATCHPYTSWIRKYTFQSQTLTKDSSSVRPQQLLQATDTNRRISDSEELSQSTDRIALNRHPASTITFTDNQKWGDDIYHTKVPNSCRIYFQNIFGLRPTNKIEGKWNDCLRVMHYYDVDIFGFVETCTNWSNRRTVQKYNSEAKYLFPKSHINYSHNKFEADSDYLPGGALQVTTGNWTGRIRKHLHDPHQMGRWTGTQYCLNDNQHLFIITLYRVGKAEQLGVISSYTQQMLALRKRFGPETAKNPRCQVLLDLQDYVSSLGIDDQDYLLIMTDSNEIIGEDQYGIRELMQNLRIIDLFTRYHQMECAIPTYRHSQQRRIDYIIGSPNLLPFITRCGYLPFCKGIDSDHRGLFLDLHSSIASGRMHISTPPQRKIGFTTSKKEVAAYKQFIINEFRQHNIIHRAQQLYDMATPSQEDDVKFLKQLNAIDQEVTDIMLQAEQQTCTKKPPFAWSPEIHNASLVIKYWMLKRRFKKDTHDMTEQLQRVYNQLDENSQIAITMSTASIRTNLHKAKLEKMELYRRFKQKHAQRVANRILADVKYTGQSFDKCERLHLHKRREDRMFQYLKTVYPKTRGKGVTHIEIPDKDALGNDTQDPNQAVSWKSILDPNDMTSHLMSRNIRHFGQSSSSPFATDPLQQVFGYCGTNEASTDLICHQQYPDFDATASAMIPSGASMIMHSLSDGNNLPTFCDVITYDEFWKAFQTWDEQTSTSPSGRHLGHYKSLLISDGVDDTYSDDNPNPGIAIRQVYYHIAIAALKSANTLNRWCRSSTMMLEKIPNQPRIHKLRVIHLYEADYNLVLKILWARKLVRHSHHHRRLHDAQAGSRPDHRCSDVVVRKEMNYQYARFTRTSLATVDNDAKACYDRILCNLAMMTSQYFGMSNRACKMHSKTLQFMKFTIKTAGGDSIDSYTHSADQPIHGSGQGSCASPSLWLHISSLLLKIFDDIAQGMTRHDVHSRINHRISAEGFVDDIALFLNHSLLHHDDLNQLYDFIHQDINHWQRLLASSGGKLELTKCFYYILSWNFNKFGDPIPKTLEELRTECSRQINIEDPDSNTLVSLNQKDVNEIHKTLGVLKTISGNDNEQRLALLAKSNTIATQTKLGQLSRFQARRAYTSIYIPAMTYSLVATSLSETALYDIQSKALLAYLPAMGYERTFPRAVVHGPRDYGGLNLGHLYTEMCIAKISAVISHIQLCTGLGRIMLTNINWLQLHSGQSQSVFQSVAPLLYLESNWFLHLREFLFSINGSIMISEQWLPITERKGDFMLMDKIAYCASLTNADRRIFNNWRIFFQVSSLSDITEPDGTKIQKYYWSFDTPSREPPKRRSRHNWPNQQQPDLSTYKVWKRGIRAICRISNQGDLHHPLGDWTIHYNQSYNDWNAYLDPISKRLYIKQTDNSFWQYSMETNLNGRSKYPSTPDDIVSHPTPACIPSDIVHQTQQSIFAVHKNFVGPLVKPLPTITDFDDFVSNLPQWRELTLLIATDGSHHQELDYGAFGVTIGGLQETLMQVRGHAPGTTGLKSSFRSETYGLLAACILLVEVTQYCRLPEVNRHRLQFYLDSTSVINRIQSHRHHPLHLGDVFAPDMDVELQILAEFQTLTRLGYTILPIQHVKSHQDEHQSYSTLSREAQLNVDADSLAASMTSKRYYNIPYSRFPSVKAQLYINEEPITSKYKERLRTAFLTQDLRAYYQQKFGWDDDVLDHIDWSAFGKAIRLLSHADRQKIQKFNIRRLHTMNREHYFNPSTSGNCQFCPTIQEDNNHVLQCQSCSELRKTVKEQWQLAIFDFLSQDHTPREVSSTLIMCINCWMNKEPIPSINCMVAHPVDPLLVKAYNHQSKIGWDNLLRGKLSIYWRDVIHQHLTKWNISSKSMTTEKWMSQFIMELWKGVLAVWDARNKEYFGHDQTSTTSKEKTKLLQEACELKHQGAENNHFDVLWFQKPMTELEQYSVISLKAWVRNARTIVRLYHHERKANSDSNRTQASSASQGNILDRSDSLATQLTTLIVGEDRQIPLELHGETIRVRP